MNASDNISLSAILILFIRVVLLSDINDHINFSSRSRPLPRRDMILSFFIFHFFFLVRLASQSFEKFRQSDKVLHIPVVIKSLSYSSLSYIYIYIRLTTSTYIHYTILPFKFISMKYLSFPFARE